MDVLRCCERSGASGAGRHQQRHGRGQPLREGRDVALPARGEHAGLGAVGERARTIAGVGDSDPAGLSEPVGERGELGDICRPVVSVRDVAVVPLPTDRLVVLLAHDVRVTRVAG